MSTAAEAAYQVLLEDILGATYREGTRLREAKLATEMGVSRTPVREALRRLSAEGFVYATPNRGVVVAGFGDADVGEIFELRALLEGYAARRAAGCGMSSTQLAQIRDLCRRMESAERGEGSLRFEVIARLDLSFHRLIHERAENARLLTVLSGVLLLPLVRHTFSHYTPAEISRSFHQHRELVDALEAADADWAESIMRAHVRAAHASLRQSRMQADTREVGV